MDHKNDLLLQRVKWSDKNSFNPLRMEVYFCHQNQNAKNIGNFTTLLKPIKLVLVLRHAFRWYYYFKILPLLGEL
jgi:hypothetical protein